MQLNEREWQHIARVLLANAVRVRLEADRWERLELRDILESHAAESERLAALLTPDVGR